MVNNKPIWVDEQVELKEKIHLHVATPVHSEVSIHFTQSLLELQKHYVDPGPVLSSKNLIGTNPKIKTQSISGETVA